MLAQKRGRLRLREEEREKITQRRRGAEIRREEERVHTGDTEGRNTEKAESAESPRGPGEPGPYNDGKLTEGTIYRAPTGQAGPGYFNRAPTSTSSRKAVRTGRPSGPTEAATIMPLDSTPRSLRGARFTTTATLRPINFSGSLNWAMP